MSQTEANSMARIMTLESPIWPAQLDHLRLDSDDPAMLADFYADALGYHKT